MKVLTIALLLLVSIADFKDKKGSTESVGTAEQDSIKYWKRQALDNELKLSRYRYFTNKMATDLDELRRKLKDCESKK